VKEAFDNNGISIPFPQTDMHLHVADSGKAAGPAVVSALSGDDTGRPRGATGYGSGDHGADGPRDDDSERG
jgi:small conductance mechanosensitive channel